MVESRASRTSRSPTAASLTPCSPPSRRGLARPQRVAPPRDGQPWRRAVSRFRSFAKTCRTP